MAMSEETARLKVELIGVDGLDNLRKKFEDVGKELVDLQDAYGRGQIKEKEFDEQTKILERSQSDLAKGIADVERAFDIVAKAAEREAKAFADAAKAAERAADAEVQAAEKEIASVLKAEHAIEEAFAREAAARQAAADREAAAAIKVAEAEAARVEKLEKSLDPAKNKMASFGQATIQTSYALQDLLQGGFGSILNNIPSIAQSLGGGAGLAGIVGGLGLVAFLARDQIANAFKAIMVESIDPLRDRTKELEKTIEELGRKEHKVPIDVIELQNAKAEVDRIKSALEAVERLRTGQAEAEQKSGKAVQEAIAEAPGGSQAVLAALRTQIVQELTAPLKERMERETADDRRRLSESEAALAALKAQGDGGSEAAAQLALLINNLRAGLVKAEAGLTAQTTAVTRIGGEADRTVGTIVDRAQRGAGVAQVQAQADLQRRLERAGMGRTAFELGQAAPEAVRADEAAQRDYENQRRAAKLRKDLERKEEEERKKDVDRLEEQLHNQDVIEKDLAKTTTDARKKQAKAAKAAADKAAAAEKRRLATLARRVGGGTLGEEAQDYAARLQERQPGISDADLRAAVQAAVTQEVARRAPQLALSERAGVISTVTEQALAAPPEDVAARQARQAAALPRRERAAMTAGYTQEAQAQGANPQQAAQIGRLATAAFEKTGDVAGSFTQAVSEFQQILARMVAQQEALVNGVGRIRAGNAALQARQRTAARNGGMN